MGRRYSVTGTRNVNSTPNTCLTVIGSTAVRIRIVYLRYFSLATPVSQQLQWLAKLFTAPGTAGSSVTPKPLDNGDPACVATAGQAHSAEPTLTTQTWEDGVSQQAGGVWYADQAAPLVAPASANNGIALIPYHASFTSAVSMHAHFEE